MASTAVSRKRIKDLITPAFVINRHAFEKNCKSMLNIASERNLAVRPHVKTHKTVEGAWIQATGSHSMKATSDSFVTGFVASTLPEIKILVDAASQYAGGPFQDVLYGVPISESKLEIIENMRQELPPNGQIHVMIDNPEQVMFVEDFVERNTGIRPFSVFVKLDTGYHRAGITCDERGVDLVLDIVMSPYLELKGLYSHCGHSYDVNDVAKQQEIASIDIQSIKSFLGLLKRRLEQTQFELDMDRLTVSIGSTPSARHHYNELLPNFNLEIHPGNYTLLDRQQLWTGACCTEEDVAGRVISRVIGHYPDRFMLDAGATALTKDSTPQGCVCAIGGSHGAQVECYKMSQEVTLVRATSGNALLLDEFTLGSMLNLLPNHSCLAAACFERYYVIDDPTCSFSPEQEIVDEWIPAKFFSVSIT